LTELKIRIAERLASKSLMLQATEFGLMVGELRHSTDDKDKAVLKQLQRTSMTGLELGLFTLDSVLNCRMAGAQRNM